MKFKLKKGKGSVKSFTDDKGVDHVPGDVVDLPASYDGVSWLERVEKSEKVVVSPAKIDVAAAVPLESPLKEKKKTK